LSDIESSADRYTTLPAGTDDIVFVGVQAISQRRPGDEENYGKISDFFTRKKEDVAADWERIFAQMQDLLSTTTTTLPHIRLDEVQFELGFSAEGSLGFIAKAGANAAVRVTFARADAKDS
jgi:hypothetical protein